MDSLARLGLETKVASELLNHIPLSDEALPDVVGMILEAGDTAKNLNEFAELLDDCQLSFDLCKSLYGLILKLRYVKLPAQAAEKSTHPKVAYGVEISMGQSDKFPALAIHDNPGRRELDFRRPDEHAPLSKHAAELLEHETGKGFRGNRLDSRKFEPLREGAIFSGYVSRIQEHGCTISFQCAAGRQEGFVHANDIAPQTAAARVSGATKQNAMYLLRKGKPVFVRVSGIAKGCILLTMRDVDQNTGELTSRTSAGTLLEDEDDEEEDKLGDHGYLGPITGIPLKSTTNQTHEEIFEGSRKKRRRLNDYERWEAQQLRSSGVIRRGDYDLEQAEKLYEAVEAKTEEDFEIEINDHEPPFLRNQTTRSGVMLSPVKILANPDGSLARAAATAGVLARERRDAREQNERAILEAIPKDMHRPWEDPNPEPGERTIAATLKGIGYTGYEQPQWKRMHIGQSVSFGQKTTKSLIEQRESLPIFRFKDKLVEAIRENQVLVVIGETGSGKTTQMTQYILEAGLAGSGIIGCTQPRRVAAMSIAKRVAEEFGCRLGQEVGYSIRFEDVTSADTIIKYMTDGILLRERIVDKSLERYSVIMLDEAHERTISTDVLFGLLKDLLRKRPEFKLIVTSATLDAEKFSEYFFSAKIFTIPGRTFPVEIFYTKEQETDYVEAALITVLQIHLTEPPGDILLFLTGQEEIDAACQTLHERMEQLKSQNPPVLIILPVYSSLPSEMQTMIFDPAPPGCRKCVVATNIAEASLTIGGISFVVDPGVAKIKVYSPKTGIESLTVVPISQANARQRAGRAGRTGPGKCYRLYTEVAYKCEMLATAVPEIQRTNLANTVLQLKAMGVNDLINFDFMDPPPIQTLINSLEVLYELGALDDEGLMTRLGRKMAEFPMEPQLGKMLLAAVDLKCTDEVITITAMLQVENVFYRPRDRQALADQKKSKFHQVEGDHITYLEVYRAWSNNRFSNPWCFENFVQARSLRRAQEVRKQLISILDRYRFEVTSAGKDIIKVRKAICAGYFRHAARKDPHEGFRTLIDNQQVYLHPSSCLYHCHPEFLLYHELVLTTKEYLRDCCTIDPNWLVELAPNLYKRAGDKKLSTRKQREKIEPLFNRYEEPNAWRLSRRRI